MIKKMGYEWHLRLRMAEHGLYATSELQPLLAERGIVLSREQVYRLVTQAPQRLSLDTLVALCDILACTPNDLITPKVVNEEIRKDATSGAPVAPVNPQVRRTQIRRPRHDSAP
ncbi:helix-turn-helix transcriptional regulator [Oerskovia sp. Sa1BUA8]|uniref:Helix-turn-helix transcriptional regulator n=1 Tax=Oerskovia douganii TaxID=2762210 RepID=A0A9D5UBX0_9CELL|nr:helix-turn-helix transcriptional regulator [Oerskovia douganii]MBE7702274.1 helix-turn-helix transcriptional regulator [Oerskovia douganii]